MKFNGLKIFFIGFILLQAFFTYKGVETFPFLNYGMYSAAINKPAAIELLSLEVNGVDVDFYQLSRTSVVFLQYNLNYYWHWVERDYESVVENTIRSRFEGLLSDEAVAVWIQQLCNAAEKEKVFGNWLASYLKPSFSSPIETIHLKIEQYSTDAPYKLLNSHVRSLYPSR